jgi:hypothetical protein
LRTFHFLALAVLLAPLQLQLVAEPTGSSSCDGALLPNLTVSEERTSENLAYLMLIDSSNYEIERRGGKIGVVLKGIPMNASFDDFSERRTTYVSQQKINYTRDEARAYLSRCSAMLSFKLGQSA